MGTSSEWSLLLALDPSLLSAGSLKTHSVASNKHSNLHCEVPCAGLTLQLHFSYPYFLFTFSYVIVLSHFVFLKLLQPRMTKYDNTNSTNKISKPTLL